MFPAVYQVRQQISHYSSVGRAGDCNVIVIPRSLVRIQLVRSAGIKFFFGASLLRVSNLHTPEFWRQWNFGVSKFLLSRMKFQNYAYSKYLVNTRSFFAACVSDTKKIHIRFPQWLCEFLVEWPSGLRRQVKALISSEARVRIPSQPIFFYAHRM